MCDISIVIPTFNSEQTIIRALRSVCNQDYSLFEIIIVDDGSVDDTVKNVYDFISQNEDVSIAIYQLGSNRGGNYARNYAVDKAKGMYVAFLDSDDEWQKHHLSGQLSFLEQNNYDGVYCSYEVFDGLDTRKVITRDLRFDESPLDYLLEGGKASTCTYLIKKAAFLDVKFDVELRRHQDYDFFLEVYREIFV